MAEILATQTDPSNLTSGPSNAVQFSVLPLPPVLRFAPSLAHPTRDARVYLPAVVAAVQDLAGEIIAVHRIYLDPASIAEGRVRKTSRSDNDRNPLIIRGSLTATCIRNPAMKIHAPK